MSPPGFLEKLTIKEQERFRKAELAAKETAKVKEARNLLNTLQKQDEECRRERLEAHREMRQTILSAMLEVDPGVKELQDRLNMSSASGPGGSKPKGSGKAKYPNVKKKSDPVLEK
jgi:soluble cytochrome b562